MAFNIPDEFRKKDYWTSLEVARVFKGKTIGNVALISLVNEGINVDFKESSWIEKNGNNFFGHDYVDCFQYVFDKLKIVPVGILSQSYTDYIKGSNFFSEVSNPNKFKKGQIVTYDFNGDEFLHIGLINDIVEDSIIIKSKWGEGLVVTSPVFKIDPPYGNQYSVHDINVEGLRKSSIQIVNQLETQYRGVKFKVPQLFEKMRNFMEYN